MSLLQLKKMTGLSKNLTKKEIKKEELSSFGKNRFKKELKNNLLKRLRMDLKNVLSIKS